MVDIQLSDQEINWLYQEAKKIFPNKSMRPLYYCPNCLVWNNEKKCEVCEGIAKIKRVTKLRCSIDYDDPSMKYKPEFILKNKNKPKKLIGICSVIIPTEEEDIDGEYNGEDLIIAKSIFNKLKCLEK